MNKDPIKLRRRFFRFLIRHKDNGNGRGKQESGVYLILGCNTIQGGYDIFYVGKTKNIGKRWKSHNVPHKIFKELGYFPSFIFIAMPENLMENYEIKLIKKLRPKFNVRHKE